MTVRPDPRLIKTPAAFARGLQDLREQSGLSLRAIALQLHRQTAGAPSFTTLGGWFNGDHLPTPKLVLFVPDLLRLCGECGEAEITEWLNALERVRSQPGPQAARHRSAVLRAMSRSTRNSFAAGPR